MVVISESVVVGGGSNWCSKCWLVMIQIDGGKGN